MGSVSQCAWRMVLTVCCLVLLIAGQAVGGFRVRPYLQHPTSEGMTVVWFSDEDAPGRLSIDLPDGERAYASTPAEAEALSYHDEEVSLLPGGVTRDRPYRHAVRVDGLEPGIAYGYRVKQGDDVFEAVLKTAPPADAPVRFVVFGDCETEPESTGKHTVWPAPGGDQDRVYILDQTDGFANNLQLIRSRRPDFIAIAGDLVESGGEQRDWDEFWRHFAGDRGGLAGSVPILAAPGNHENYGGPGALGQYSPDDNRRALAKFTAYFQRASSDDEPPRRYHRLDYGPVTLITLDSSNGLPDDGEHDTNWYLDAQSDDTEAIDFNPGSPQYRWLEEQLADAQKRSAFTFVQFHHVPYSVGPHGLSAGDRGPNQGQDSQSGVPMRALTPLFMRYGVDAVFAGHDEMYEHSLIPDGVEQLPDGTTRPHRLHVYDVGIAGDGLRGPYLGPGGKFPQFKGNGYQVFLAHLDAPEVWEGKRLVSGGKHYGHLEVNVTKDQAGHWMAVLTPAYVFPLMDERGSVIGWERRVYEDVLTLSSNHPSP